MYCSVEHINVGMYKCMNPESKIDLVDYDDLNLKPLSKCLCYEG